MKIHEGNIPIIELGLDESLDSLKEKDLANYFVLQNGNLFKLSNTPLHTILSPIDKNKGGEILKSFKIKPAYEQDLHYLLNNNWDQYKIPKNLFRYVMKYFREIFHKHRTEAAVFLFLNIQTKEWKPLIVPQVKCSYSGVNYLLPKDSLASIEKSASDYDLYKAVFEDKEMSALMKKAYNAYNKLSSAGFQLFGTIHSHCDFNAFHSGVDDADEKDFNGLHITIGHVDKDWSYAARWMLNRCEWKIEILDCVDATSLEDLQKDIDNVKIYAEHMQYINPELGRSSNICSLIQTNYYNSKNNDDQSYGPYGLWDSYQPNGTSQQPSSFNKFEMIHDLEGIVYEAARYRMLDTATGKAFWIPPSEMSKCKEKYGNRVIQLPDPPVPNSQGTIDQELDEDFVPVEELLIFDQESKSLKSCGYIDNIQQFVQSRRKATKI